jgi:hypothetical protein
MEERETFHNFMLRLWQTERDKTPPNSGSCDVPMFQTLFEQASGCPSIQCLAALADDIWATGNLLSVARKTYSEFVDAKSVNAE